MSFIEYLFKNLGWLVVDKGNNSGTAGLDKFNVGGGDIRNAGGIAKATGGTVAGVAEDSNDGPVVKVGVSCGATRRRWTQWVIIYELTREKNVPI